MADNITYSIDSVINLDLNGTHKYHSARGYNIDCPFCRGKRKLNVRPDLNVYRCPKCDAHGSAVGLHMQLMHFPDKRTAAEDLYKRLGAEHQVPVNISGLSTRPNFYNREECHKYYFDRDGRLTRTVFMRAAQGAYRQGFYQNFLNHLPLLDYHKDDLLRRGLTEQDIEQNGYKSTPLAEYNAFPDLFGGWVIMDKFHELEAERDLRWPGAYRGSSGNWWWIKPGAGFFIPVRDWEGRISGMQIRFDPLPENASENEKERYHKYAWYSSSWKKSGCGVEDIPQIHFTSRMDSLPRGTDTLYLTEGALKADVAAKLSGKPFIALIGVSNQIQLHDALTMCRNEYGIKRIVVCLDMDYRTNPFVARARRKAIQVIKNAGLEAYYKDAAQSHFFTQWEESGQKGIDDFLLAQQKE